MKIIIMAITVTFICFTVGFTKYLWVKSGASYYKFNQIESSSLSAPASSLNLSPYIKQIKL